MSSCGERTRLAIFCQYGAMRCDGQGGNGTAASWFWTIWSIILVAAVACMIAGSVKTDDTHSFNKTGWGATCNVTNCVDLGPKLHRYELTYEVTGQSASATLFDRTRDACSVTTKLCFVRLNSENRLEIHWFARTYRVGLGLLIPSCIWLLVQILWLMLSCAPQCCADVDRAEAHLQTVVVQKRGYDQVGTPVPKTDVGSPV